MFVGVILRRIVETIRSRGGQRRHRSVKPASNLFPLTSTKPLTCSVQNERFSASITSVTVGTHGELRPLRAAKVASKP